MGKLLTCPCGEPITARDDDFIAKVNAHLEANHGGRSYPDEAIMSMASDYDDALITD
ncbi:MAG: hypothetical protein JWP31_1353 [Aeromicrobium sp.]|nr:hypothetical protein [Aeromicrobium sp.]